MTLPRGLYERLVLEDEHDRIEQLAQAREADLAAPSDTERRALLIDEVSRQLPALLDAAADGDEDTAARARSELRLIARMLQSARDAEAPPPLPALPLRVLRSIHAPGGAPSHPVTGVRRPWLFTSGRADPSLLAELRAELASVDRVDVLVSFITWSGVRKLIDVLRQATALDANGAPRTRLRILTTTYIGATEAAAVDELARLPGAELRVSLDGRRTRLHAKAWIFRRATGFGTAFVGSANLSGAALIGGIEWTLKITQAADPALYETAQAHFEALWNDAEFQPYDPSDDAHRDALARAIAAERGGARGADASPIAIQAWFDLRPKAYQQEMLDRLAYERRHGRMRNLVVAATGTGKTVVAAFDYLRLAQQEGAPPRLLFVAHRAQILLQALATYRQVLRDPAFGDLLDGDTVALQHDHLFATIQTLSRRGLVERMGAAHWRVVVIDEAHHLPAASFDRFATTVRPHILLGLTATPERADGSPLGRYFDARPDGGAAVSLRLWDALDQQLLAPFEYYATSDSTDLNAVRWSTAEEAAQLDGILGANHARARIVVDALRRYVGGATATLRALAFCVSVRHAQFMARTFREAGLDAVALSGESSAHEREQAIRRLRSGELRVICSCDLFNEGVDIPEIDTVLLLRPTQSPVVFQQQIGRGLRLADGKESCLVLDFVGAHSTEFRFDLLLRSLTGLSRAEVLDAVEHGFGRLPSGCHIQFDRVARQQVLENLKSTLNLNFQRLTRELAAWAALRGAGAVTLRAFLDDNRIELDDVYRAQRGWTSLKRAAGFALPAPGPREDWLCGRVGSVLHTNDPTLIAAWSTALRTGATDDPARLQMLAHQLLPSRTEHVSPDGLLAMLDAHPAIRAELRELLGLLDDAADIDPTPLPGAPAAWPLALHGRYELREILAATGHATAQARPFFNAGVLPLEAHRIELMFVTLDKREGFAERVQYHDYAISPALFHWQTQNRAAPTNATGRRYLDSATNGWTFQLFVRADKDSPYVALGPATMVSHEGQRPISITWRLQVPMPAGLFRQFSVLRGA